MSQLKQDKKTTLLSRCPHAIGWLVNLATPITNATPDPAIFPKPSPFKTIPFKYDKRTILLSRCPHASAGGEILQRRSNTNEKEHYPHRPGHPAAGGLWFHTGYGWRRRAAASLLPAVDYVYPGTFDTKRWKRATSAVLPSRLYLRLRDCGL
jgi:hypothetical protein